MSRRVIGYTGEGRAKTPVYASEPPAVARRTGYVANAAQRGYAVIGGVLVQAAPGSVEHGRQYHREYMARKRAEGRT